MPTNSVVNRRSVDSPFIRRTIHASSGALEAVGRVAAALSVSKASIIDSALWHVTSMESTAIAELLRHHGHLTEDEYRLVAALLTAIPPGG